MAANTGTSDLYKFNLQVKPYVERIFLFQALGSELRFLSEMRDAQLDSEDAKVFNGVIPQGLSNITAFLGASEQSTSYTFNELFSHPLDKKKPMQGEWRNTIIVNAPKETYAVLVSFPLRMQEVLRLPKFAMVYEMSDKARKELNKQAPIASFGIDIEGKTFVATIPLHISPEESRDTANWERFIEQLGRMEINVLCFLSGIYKQIM